MDRCGHRGGADLFGTDRVAFPPLRRQGLHELQGGRCFYCDAAIPPAAAVDHFLAWSRWPNDAIENLVLADRCNGDKSDHLTAPQHLVRWAQRMHGAGSSLREIAEASRWMSDPNRTVGLVRSTYGHVAPGTPLWRRGREFEEARGPIDVPV